MKLEETMNQQIDSHDSHVFWLDDIEYREEFGAETAKLEIAAALVRARALTKMTQSALAEAAGTSQAYIARLERGDANPTIGNIGRLLACMWLKPSIVPMQLDPSKSIESIVIENLNTQEASVDFSELAPRESDYRVLASI